MLAGATFLATTSTAKTLKAVGWVMFGFGGFVCLLNFYLVVIRHRLYRLRERQAEYRNISGFPFIGTIAVLFSLICRLPLWAWIVGIVLAALDLGGPHWFIAIMVWQLRKGGGAPGATERGKNRARAQGLKPD